MRRFLIALTLLVSAFVLVSCNYDQATCTTCGYTPTATYVATTSYVPKTTYVATTRYVPTSNYVVTPTYAPAANCCSTNCCPTCNRCGSAYNGYGSGPNYGYEYNNSTWY